MAPRISGEIFLKAVLSLSSDIYRGLHKLRAAILGNNNTGQTLQTCRPAGRISQGTAVAPNTAWSQCSYCSYKVITDTKDVQRHKRASLDIWRHSSCCSWRMSTYLFLLQTGHSHSWPDSTLYSRQLLHTRTLQPLQHGHRVNSIPRYHYPCPLCPCTCRRRPCWWCAPAPPCTARSSGRGPPPTGCWLRPPPRPRPRRSPWPRLCGAAPSAPRAVGWKYAIVKNILWEFLMADFDPSNSISR